MKGAHRLMFTRLTTLTAILSATLTLLVAPSSHADPAAQAQARGVGYSAIIEDSIRGKRTPNDLWQVDLYAANSGEPASITLHFNGPVPYEGETRVYLNFDRDTRPEAAIAMGGNHYRLYKVRGWRDHGVDAACGNVNADITEVTIEFGPSCMGARQRGKMALSVVSTYPGVRTDYVPGARKWSRKVRTYQPN